MSNTEPNLYESSARNQKAGQLAGFLAAFYSERGALPQAVQAATQISRERWDTIAELLGLNPPSEETIEAALIYLANIAAAIKKTVDL